MEMPKAYEAKDFEDKIYREWEASGLFNPDNLNLPKKAEPYTIILPPPNITAKLHMGHAMTLAIEDLFIRYKRMKGFRTLWLPGTDHAAIATQNVVEKKLWNEEKKTRHDLGREKFLEKVWEFLRETQSVILKQTRKMGASLDWSRQAFTLDEPRARAVAKMFVDMYSEGVIYRGERVVNWCPRCHSTLADDEVEYKEQKAVLFTFKYDKNFPIAIATTRLETKLGDTAVAVNPKDERYKKYIGKEFAVNFVGVPLKIKIIADWQVDMSFGTGALGVTPAHSMVDWQMAKANNLQIIKAINEDGNIHEGFGEYSGKSALEARKMIVEKLEAADLLEKQEEIDNNLSICYRCATPIEPLPSKQWFVAVDKKLKRLGNKSLKEKAIEAAEENKIEFIPGRFEKRYLDWMNNMQDWCVSRQIWFGHRIPVWYCEKCGEAFATDKPATEFFVLRHGEANSNLEDKLNSDIKNQKNGLTEKGRDQIVAAAEKLTSEEFDIIFSSDFKRTQESARIVADRLGIKKIILDKRLREVGFGEFEGKTDKEFTEFRRKDFEAWHYDSPRGIESFAGFKKRVFEFFDEVTKKYPGKKILVVTHGDVARVAKGFQTNLSDKEIYDLTYPDNGAFELSKFLAVGCSCGAGLKQDEDSLDTWFSSGMWTFSTLGWPNNVEKGKKIGDLKTFHPTQMLETGYEIITLWVSRMVMMSFFALNEIPFEKVYLHGMVLDKNGKKMSKSRGNGIDPLDMVEKYGADASRLALLVGSTPGNDVRFSEEKVADCRNFVNKLWNVSRFILMSVETRQGALKPKTLADKWIAEHLRKLVYTVGVALENNDFSFAGEAIREFMWSQLADWYLEVSKIQKRNDELLIYILETLLKLCHPFAPFVTEQIWHEMGRDKMLMIEKFPEEKEIRLSRASEDFGLLQKIIIEIRNWRAVQKVEPKEKINVTIFVRNKIVEENADIIKTLARLDKLTVDSGKKELGAAVYELKIDREFDLEKETARLEKERAKLEDYVVALDAKLSNEDFLKKAPAAVVEDGKKKLAEAKEKVAKIVGRLGEF